MPKAAVGQTGFNTGEVSPLFYGATENPRYKKGLETALNYLPLLQGPLTRRPGTKNVANSKQNALLELPPVLIPFKFSVTQNYILEFGDRYIRFYANNGQMVTSGSSYKLSGARFFGVSSSTHFDFYATRLNTIPQPTENISVATGPIASGTILELQTPYNVDDLPLLRYAQNNDVMYLTHPKYKTYKLERQSQTEWKLDTVYLIDGPYLPANSFLSIGDNVDTILQPLQTNQLFTDVMCKSLSAITNVSNSGISNQIQITTNVATPLVTGQKVFISGVTGTTEANNYSTYSGRAVGIGPTSWTVQVLSLTSFVLLGSTFTHAYVNGGSVYYALFDASAKQALAGLAIQDIGRSLALVQGGIRYWGSIFGVYDAATVINAMGGTSLATTLAFPNTNPADEWFLGKYSGNVFGGVGPILSGNGYPAVAAFHQNRLCLAGCPTYPQDFDSSNTGLPEYFAPSDQKTLNVSEANSCNFTLNSGDSNPIRWMESTAQGLCAGTDAAEWAITPSGNSEALTPTNFNAQQSSFYGSAQIAAAKIGNAVLYVQRAARKLRELAFVFMSGTFRSEDLTEISEHITIPAITKIAVQKETQPLIWGIRSDGALVSLIYNRNDVALSVGWTRHILGGVSDNSGTPPIISSIAFIPDPTGTFDQMWLVVKRLGVYAIEYMTKISDDSILQEDSYQLDGGGTYDLPLTITNVSIANPAVITSALHGLANGDLVKITDVVGVGKTTTDINGFQTTTNLLNEIVFVVAGAAANTFQLHDFSGNPISSLTYGGYISGGKARKLVSTISGLTWLLNQTVSVLADGSVHPDCLVSNAGVISLQYPAAKVQIGFKYKSQGKLLRAEAGAADGTSIGKTRRTSRAAIQMHRCGDLAIGTSFDDLIPISFGQGDQNQANVAIPLFSGIIREGIESPYSFESQLCFEQSSPLPGTIQSITTFMEEFDV